MQQNISLADFCTFKTGGLAKYFVVVKNIEGLKQAVNFATQNSLPVFVLGCGSNLLISDEGVYGLIIKIEMKGIEFEELNTNTVQVSAGAGEIWDELVEKCVEKGLYGLENLSLVPGTVGASVVQNIEAYGGRVQDVVDWVEVFDIKTNEIKKIPKENCEFGYKDSIFKKESGENLVVVRVGFSLKKEGVLQFGYKDVERLILERGIKEVSLQGLRNIIVEIRKNKFPDLKKTGTAGSFFKNPVVNKKQLEDLKNLFPDLQYYSCDQNFLRIDNGKETSENAENFRIALAYILDKGLGLKGVREGCVGSHEKQSLVLVNYGEATSTEIKNLAQKITEEVKEKTGLDIEPEVVFWN